MERQKRERRAIGGEVATKGRKVSGYAAVFNRRSEDLCGFTEIIAPTAFEGVVGKSDVLCVLNHQVSRGILARSRNGEGTLILTVDEIGLRYEFEAPNTALGDEVLEMIKRGDIFGSSFAFSVKGETWVEESDGNYLRTITQISELYDVSPVYSPAYNDTTVALRSLSAYREEPDEVPEVDDPDESADKLSDEDREEGDLDDKEEKEEPTDDDDDKDDDDNESDNEIMMLEF